MPTWLSLDFVAANWQPLLVALILGYVLGWLFTGIPNKRHANEAEDRAASLDARLRKSERELTDVRREGENAKTRLANAQSDLDVARARIHELETPPIEESVEEVENRLDEVAIGADALADDAFVPEEALDESSAALLAEVAGAVLASLGDEPNWAEDETMTMLIPALSDEETADVDEETVGAFAAVARTPDLSTLPSAKDIALNEAYARATALQGDLERVDNALKAQAAELESARAELAVANAARSELESRLVRAREDVASELAVLASTMIKMKDDALARADARIASLTAETDALRAQKSLPMPTIPTPVIPSPAKPAPTAALAVAEPPADTASNGAPGPVNMDASAEASSGVVASANAATNDVQKSVEAEEFGASNADASSDGDAAASPAPGNE